jgi:3-oxoacyl-ACP reductase-like protein
VSIFGNIMSAIFGHSSSAAAATPPSAPAAGAPASSAAPPPQSAPAAAAPITAPAAPVDVTAIMDGLAAKSSEKLDWRKSIVDLMKLINLDSSLAARKELAQELSYTGDTNDSASMNIWLHKQVMTKLAENGGKVPDELRV